MIQQKFANGDLRILGDTFQFSVTLQPGNQLVAYAGSWELKPGGDILIKNVTRSMGFSTFVALRNAIREYRQTFN